MKKKAEQMALFKMAVLGPLVSRARLEWGELKQLTQELAEQVYDIPYSNRCRLSAKTIERWYYAWRKTQFTALTPKQRCDAGGTHIDLANQATILQLKQDNPARSLDTLLKLLGAKGITVSRSSLHRFLQQQQQSHRIQADVQTIERRSFEARHAGDIWQGDVLHGPVIPTINGKRRVYLVSLMDDASRLIVHSAFCLGETAVDIEGVLKEALLKRGIPKRLIIDNGAAYRAHSLQVICAKLGIRLVYCKPYEPQGKDCVAYCTSIVVSATTFFIAT